MTTTPDASAIRVTDAAAKAFLDATSKQMLVGGQWVDAQTGETFDVFDPATEQSVGRAAEAGAEDVDRAVRAARFAFESGPWPNMAPRERSAILRRWADLIYAHAEELAQIESQNNGLALQISRMLAPYCAEVVYYFAGAAPQVHGTTPQSPPANFNYTTRTPIGVCAAITPWNGPLPMATWKIAPALAAGNTVVIKPAEQTPFSTLRLVELLQEAGLPDGVLNVVTGGPAAGAALTRHPEVDKVAFTGSTEVGKEILAAAASNMKRVTLELGGKSPNIIFADADLTTAAAFALNSMTFVSGQVCSAGTRLFVQRDVHDEVVEKISTLARDVVIGDPLDAATQMGPLASREQFERVSSYLAIGKSEAKVGLGGDALTRTGYFVPPTLFVDVQNDMRIAQEEIFGPVLSVIPFSDEDDVIKLANQTRYGLGAGIWTRDVSRAHRVARGVRAGTVWINTYGIDDPSMPWGGFKESGIGRELGLGWYNAYTEEKSVMVQL